MLATAYTADLETTNAGDVGTPSRSRPVDLLAKGLVDGPLRTFEAKEHIFREGDAVSHVYQVEIGHVCIYRMMSDGRRQVIDFAYPGDMIALGAIAEHAANGVATTRTRVRCLPIASLQHVMKTSSSRDAVHGHPADGHGTRRLLPSRSVTAQ
jgi:CRP/FNR family transcriptional regulator, anaerobic regulatory protein